jgi:DNA-binding transcriptional LysR family regulator
MLVANHASMLIEAACRGLGILYMPMFHAAPYLQGGQLLRVLPAWRWPTAVHAVFPNARHLSIKVRAFVDLLVEHFREPPWSPSDAR